jgi:acid phosphatase
LAGSFCTDESRTLGLLRIYSASSARDVDSSTAFISGLLPNRSIGTSKGQVDLVKVPNTNADWAFSLTPHKICDRFDKKQGKEERDAFQKLAAGPVIERLGNEGELEGWKWDWTDVIAMQQMCGGSGYINVRKV